MEKFSDLGTTGNGRRRRRMIPDDPEDVPDKQSSWIDDRYSLMSQIFFKPEPSYSSEDEDEEQNSRDARLMLYWLTTTSYTTTYVSTSTIATIDCTPNGFTMAICNTVVHVVGK